jgi:hypothetical protein
VLQLYSSGAVSAQIVRAISFAMATTATLKAILGKIARRPSQCLLRVD